MALGHICDVLCGFFIKMKIVAHNLHNMQSSQCSKNSHVQLTVIAHLLRALPCTELFRHNLHIPHEVGALSKTASTWQGQDSILGL